nr:reverse transcriptase domain-containing protein [Tanacetum cinerariifolium]
MADRTMEELLQAPTEGYGEAIVIPEILAFEIKTNLLQLVQANKFHGFERDDPHTHISNFKRMTATLKYRDVPNDAIKLMLFPYSLEGAARVWYEKEPPNSILTWDDLVNKFVNQFFPPSKTTHLKNEIYRFTQRFKETFSEAWDRFKELLRACPHHGFSEVNTNSMDNVSKTDDRIDKLADQISNLVEIVNKQVIASAKAVEKTYVTCGGAHAYYECIATDSNPSSVCAATGSYKQNLPSTSGTLPSNTIPNPKGEMKAVTTRSGLAYEGPSIPTESPLEKVDEQNTEEILDKEHSNSSGSTAQVQPSIVPILISKPDVSRTQTKPKIPYPSSFADALLLMPKFASTIKSLLANKEKLFELAKVPLNENCLAMLLKKLPEKLGDPELTPTRMTLELADRSITRPKGVAEDVFVKVGKFHFPTDFIVVDFEADPRVPLILGRSFLRTGRALIDVYGEEITLRVNDESITFNLNQTMRYSSTYDDTSVNRVNVIDIACEEFVQDVLDFHYKSKSSGPTLVSDDSISENDSNKEPIVKSSSPTLTPFGESDFFLEEIEDFLNDDSIPTGIENSVYDPEGDIIFLEKLLNEDPFQLPPIDLKLAEESKEKSSVEEPPVLELKELPSHLEYVFLEDSNKLPVIIAKNLKVDEKEALINILIEDDYKPTIQSQRRLNLKIHDVIKKEVIKLLDAGMIYHISDSLWVSPIHCVPKKGGMTVVANENNELILTRLVTGWRVCIDYRKLNDATRKDHFPLPFMDQMLERLAWNEFYCFLDGFSGYFQIPIDPQDQERTTFTCPYGTFAYRRMPFGLCNAPGHKISKSGIEVDRAKVDVIAKLPHPTTVKGVRSFLGHAEKETPFIFSKECIDAFNTLKKKLTEALILVVPDWNLPLELMCDASDYAIAFEILKDFHEGPLGGHHGANFTAKKRQGKISQRDETPQNTKALPTNDARVIVKFLKSIFSRFDIPRAIISDRGTHFCNDQFTRVMIKYGVTHRLATAYHPQTSGQVELVYGKSCHLLIELEHRAYWALKHVNFDLKTAGDHRKLQLNELSELRDQAYENSVIYKERTKKLHDSKIKNRIFNVGDQVLLFNSRLKIFSKKLKTRWSGPFTITNVFPYGTIELSQPNGLNFKVNGHRVKHYFCGDIPSNVALDLHTFPMDN